MKLKKTIILINFLLAFLTCKKENKNLDNDISYTKNYLSIQWVEDYTNKLVYNDKEKEEINDKIKELVKEGVKLHKIQNFTEAIFNFKLSIDLFPTAEAYFHFGNSLFSLNQLEDSVLVYEISIKIYNNSFKDTLKQPELLFYNLACVYSRLGNINKAYTNLSMAIEHGYNAFNYLEKDPDLINLRKESDWIKNLNSWKKLYNYNEENLIGLIFNQPPRQGNYIILCKNRTLIRISHILGRNPFYGFERGTWELLKNGDLKFIINEVCYPQYIFTKKEKESNDNLYRGASGFYPPGRPDFSNGCISLKNVKDYKNLFYNFFRIPEDFIEKKRVKNFFKPNQEIYNESEYKYKQIPNEPKACELEYHPTNLEDINIEKLLPLDWIN